MVGQTQDHKHRHVGSTERKNKNTFKTFTVSLRAYRIPFARYRTKKKKMITIKSNHHHFALDLSEPLEPRIASDDFKFPLRG